MKSLDVEKRLIVKGIKPTPNRLLVLRQIQGASHPLSLADLEALLDFSIDRASIFRVLELFVEREVVHVIEDGSRAFKYELCHGVSHHSISDQHAHFYCERCKETYCFDTERIPPISIPEGFQPQAVNYMVKGTCPKCAEKEPTP